MAAAILIKGIITLFIGGALSFVVMPAMYNLYTDAYLWNGVSGAAITTRDNLYTLFQYMPIIAGAVPLLWMFTQAVRRDVNEYY